jgi:hypothetical protein
MAMTQLLWKRLHHPDQPDTASFMCVFVNLEVGLASATTLLGAPSDMNALVVVKIIIHDAAPSFLSFVL